MPPFNYALALIDEAHQQGYLNNKKPSELNDTVISKIIDDETKMIKTQPIPNGAFKEVIDCIREVILEVPVEKKKLDRDLRGPRIRK